MISKKTYQQLISQYSDRIYTYLAKNMKDKSMAEDLTQDCFLKLWNNRLFLNEPVAKTWLFKTAYNSMLNYLRKNKRLSFDTDSLDRDNQISNPYFPDTQDLLNHIFEQLTTEEKTIILLRDQEGYTYEEIAKIMDISDSGVKTKLFRARQKFKQIAMIVQKQEKHIRYE
jgi:RNA polymerase sigma factor (sigma-70 family)